MATKILIVDDDPICRDIIADNLQEEGRAVTRVACGLTALESLDREAPQLIILDCALPGKTGIEVLRHVRSNIRLKRIPVFLVSARQSEGYQAAMLAEGAQAFFTKPLDLPRMRAAVRDLLQPR